MNGDVHQNQDESVEKGSMIVGDKITVFLADDNVIVREGVRALLALEADLESSASPATTTS